MANIIVIVGHPNVGKSTLFNRLIGTKKAITDDVEGVTRDRQYGTVEWCGHHFTIVDTGGYIPKSKNIFEKEILNQITIAIEEACAILFVLDCKQGLTEADKTLGQILRKTNKPVLLVANKADTPTLSLNATSFHTLGLGKIHEISATHGTGTGDLLDQVITHLSKEEETKETKLPKLTILGRPNVGKSTLLNAVLGKQRSTVTPLANTTRDAIDSYYHLYGKQLIITDTAGIRKKAQVKENIEFYSVIRSIKALQQADVCMMLLDAKDGLTTQDLNIIGLIHRHKKGIVLLINKWDCIHKDNNTLPNYKKKIIKQLGHMRHIPILFISGLKKQRIYQAIEKALEVYNNRCKRIPTALLNKVIHKAITNVPPPATKGKLIKIKYATQLPTPTPVFAFFCNLPQYISPAYRRYLANQLHQYFGFLGVPITLVFKKK